MAHGFDTARMPQGAHKIVVTGGAGFIGSHLVDRLLAKEDNEVVVFDNLSRGRLSNVAQHRANPHFQLIEGDVRNTAAIADVVRGATTVYHLAAQPPVLGSHSDRTPAFETNVVGTFNVLQAVARAGVERVLFASSLQVYGEPINLPVQEDSPLLAISSYGAGKVAGEAFCRAFRRELGVHVSILRFANVYGPRDTDRVIALWIDQALAGQEIQVFGGKQVIDVVWVDQVVEAMLRTAALAHPMPPTNIAGGTGTRIVELARRIGRLAGSHSRIRLQPARPMDVTRCIANVDRMRQILEIEPPLDPLVNLPRMIPAAVHV
jgi:UDP-glucose 4-epimerase